MMSKDGFQQQQQQQRIRERFMMLAESTKPFNVKRKSITKQMSKGASGKLSMQDFVRMDPSYTPDIEHLVFPSRKRNPQQVAPTTTAAMQASSAASKTRSRLAEMFALSRHLQQRSADRESSKSARKASAAVAINRSVDSMLETPRDSGIGSSSAGSTSSRRVSGSNAERRWAGEEPVHAVRRSPNQEPDMATTRGPNVSVLHLRSTSEPWETSPTSVFTSVSTGSSRSYSSSRSTSTSATTAPGGAALLPKQESLNFPTSSYKYGVPSAQHRDPHAAHSVHQQPTRADTYSGDVYLNKSQSCGKRELSPMRWCDREVDGVYLNRSGWVQVQHRSLDESRRLKYVDSLSASRRTGLKLAEYQHISGKMPPSPAPVLISASAAAAAAASLAATKCEPQRPAYLPLKANDYEPVPPRREPPAPPPRSPSPIMCESFSPPSLTPIISPPPAFQDRTRASKPTTRTFFGKAPFLPRSNAIIDSDPSPPPSPGHSGWKNAKASSLPLQSQSSIQRKTKTPSPVIDNTPKYPRIPQTKSLEDTSANRRTKFSSQKYESSSSSSQSQSQTSQQFRSLDSYMPRPAMPRLSENTDSSIDVYEDADDEDNNSSSINMSISTKPITIPNLNSAKISPSSRNSRPPYRTNNRKSPVGSDTKPTSPGSSSSSSQEFAPSRSPSSTTMRRTPTARQYQPPPPTEDPKVRRSRSLQLPDKKANYLPQRVSPQQPDGTYRVIKVPQITSVDRAQSRRQQTEEELDAEMLREADIVTGFIYGSRSRAAAQALLISRYDKKDLNGHGYKQPAPKQLQRGATTPTQSQQSNKKQEYWGNQYQSRDRDRESSTKQGQQPMMRSSQSYPTHQRSLEVEGQRDRNRERERERDRDIEREREREPYKKRVPRQDCIRRASPNEMEPRRLSPNLLQAMDERRRSSPKFKSSSSSSSDYAVIIPEKVRVPRSAKSSGASTPLEDPNHLNVNNCARGEVILTRPGSAPGNQPTTQKGTFLDSSQRSMSLPKSFLSHRQGGQFPWRRRGTESLGSSPGFRRRTPIETSQTAPVTPLHDGNRRRSPSSTDGRRAKANSTPQLIDGKDRDGSRKYKSANSAGQTHAKEGRKQFSGNAESVLQKFRKTFSLRFQKSSSRTSKDGAGAGSVDLGDSFAEPHAADQVVVSEEEATSPQRAGGDAKDVEPVEQKHRFGPLIWRSSKERKKMNKAARSMKCNSGDSGIQIEMAPGCGGIGGDNSSESHGETDPQGDDLDNSPPAVRRRGGHARSAPRPHSDLLNQILIDRFKAELRTRAHRHQHVRRTHSDLGGQRIYCWEAAAARSSGRGAMSSSSPSPLRSNSSAVTPRPQSPRKRPDGPPHVQMRNHPLYRRGQLRRSLSQPLDIDKLSPIMKAKTGIKVTNVASEDENDMRLGTSDEDTMSDSESSLASLSERKKSLELPMDEEVVILAEAVFDHVAIDAEELAFRAGDVVEVVDTNNRDWWWGSAAGKSGWFPVNSVRLRVSQEDTVEDCLASIASGKPAPNAIRRRTSISLLSNDQVRTSVVRELVNTERDFVKVLQDVAEGYVAECRKREDMFSKEQIDTIFINLEEILKFQTAFLRDLESCIDWEAPHKSCVGACFIKHKDGFKMYSDYCNSHPMATATLQELYQFNNYSKFFEACRLMRGLIEIPLDGYLLTPVQRICKYPLQLAELLKYSKADHADYDDIKEALEAMKGVAVLINERKRRMESLEKIEAWQQRVEGWEGEDLIEVSTQLIHQGEVVRVTTGLWTSNIMMFLFDHQLVYCKKDILKRNTYMYKGRICLNTAEVIDMPDGKDPHLGVNLRHAIKIYSLIRDKFLLVCCRSVLDKQRWLQAFAEERRLVNQDECDGMDFPASSRHLAKIAARCQRRPPRKLRNKESYKRDVFVGSNLHLNGTNTNSLGRKVGTWFTFGGNKKTRHRDVS